MASISLIVTAVVLALAAIGFLLGLMRGVRRSLVRLGVVLLSAFLAFFLATSIAGTFLNTPISEFDISMEGTGVAIDPDQTLHEFMVAALQSDETMAELVEAAPTLTNFITLLPQAIISEVLFIALFFLLKVVLWIPEKIIDWTLLRKKGSHLFGGLVGAVQGVVCASILLVPLFALVPMINSAADAASALSQETKDRIEIVATIEDLDRAFTQQIKSDPVYSVLDAIGVRSMGEGIFYSLSTASTESGESICVFGEIRDALPVVVKIMPLTSIGGGERISGDDIDAVRSALDSVRDSHLISATLYEVITTFAQKMEAGEPFLGFDMSFEEGEAPVYSTLLRDLFPVLADSDEETLMNDLSDVLDLVDVLVESGLMDPSEGESMSVVDLLNNKTFTADLLTTMVNSHLLAPVSVSAINNLAIASLADALELPEEDRDALKVASLYIFRDMSQAERDAEVARLVNILAGAAETIPALENGLDFENNLDSFKKIGTLLNGMSESTLLSNSAKGMMKFFLDMDEVKEVMTASSLALIRAKIDEGTINYEATLGSIAAAYEMANALNVSNPDLNDSEKLAGAVENLFASMDETTAEILKETINTEMLENMGIPEDTADVASTVLGTFFEEVAKSAGDETIDFEKEAAAVESVLGMITDASSGGTPSEAVTDTVIESILESQTITNTVINVGEEVDLSGFLTDTDRETVADVLDNYSNDAVDQEKLDSCLDALRNMLGIQR